MSSFEVGLSASFKLAGGRETKWEILKRCGATADGGIKSAKRVDEGWRESSHVKARRVENKPPQK